MSPARARYVTVCQQLLALGVVVIALVPATRVVSLDVVGVSPGSGTAQPTIEVSPDQPADQATDQAADQAVGQQVDGSTTASRGLGRAADARTQRCAVHDRGVVVSRSWSERRCQQASHGTSPGGG